jgi:predicted porin
MKKSLIALAVLAASGAAMAQSSVTLFGRLDAGVGYFDREVSSNNPANVRGSQSQTVVNSSTFNTTYWGLKGTEDLGGGLKANFNLQSGFAIDTGIGNTGLFERNATVGLSGGFGTVNLGRQYTPYYALYGATAMIGNANLDAEAVYGAGLVQGVTRASNSIRYDSPSFSGFTVSGLVGLGENDNLSPDNAPDNAGGDSTDTYSLNVMYKAGPLLVGYGYQERKLAQATVGAQQDKLSYNMIGASYDFGVAKITGGYQKVENDLAGAKNQEDDEFNVGVSVPVGPSTTLWAGYADSQSDFGNGNSLDSNGYTLAATYQLSKRTKLYGAYAYTEIESSKDQGVTVDNTETSKFAVGVVHLF